MSSAMTEVAVRLAEPDRMAEQSVASLGQTVRRQVAAMNHGISLALSRAGELEAIVHGGLRAIEHSNARSAKLYRSPEGGKKDTIFVNYRRGDAKAEAARLYDRLANVFGAENVFMDVDTLLVGERFDIKLEEALADAYIFLAVIGSRWLDLLIARAKSGERDYVREEIAAALAGNIIVVPILMDNVTLPDAAELAKRYTKLSFASKTWI